jgi:hypothetical protein
MTRSMVLVSTLGPTGDNTKVCGSKVNSKV